MNSDNPYAAPQTIEPRQDAATLPVAEGRGDPPQRRRYPDRSTAELQRMFDQSQQLEALVIVWFLLLLTAVALAAAMILPPSASSDTQKVLGWILIATITARLGCSFWRSKLGRWLMLLADGLLFIGCLTLLVLLMFGIILHRESVWILGMISVIILTVSVLTYRSCKMLVKADELFHPECMQHDDLMRELAHRQEHQIS